MAEVCRSSQSCDLGAKLELYERAGVAEFIAVLREERRLEGGRYALIAPDREGILKSAVFPGLWIDEAAFWARDSRRLIEVVELGLVSGGVNRIE